jgi:autotransporter-associated beta strand protein
MKTTFTFRHNVELPSLTLGILLLGFGTLVPTFAADRIKQNNTTALNLAGSWDTLPDSGGGDVGVWTNIVAGANASALGAGVVGGVHWLGIRIANPGGLVTIGNTTTAAGGDLFSTTTDVLTLGTSGIDMSAATQNLLINGNLTIGGNQTWTVANARTLQIQTINTPSRMTGSGNLNLVNASGAGTALFDFRPGNSGSTAFTDQNGFYGYSGNWTINSGVEVRTLRNGQNCWGSGTITLAGGTVAQHQNYNGTWLNNISLQTGTTSTIDDKNSSGSRTLKLQGVVSGDGNLNISETGAASHTTDGGVILTAANTLSGIVTINSPAVLRVGGVPGVDTATTVGSSGTLGTATVINNSTLTLSRDNTWTFANNVSGSGVLRIGLAAGSATHIVTVSGSNTHSGGVTLQSAVTLKIGSTNALGSGTFTVAGNGLFDNATGGPLTMGNGITMSGGSPTFNGTDDMTFTGAVLISGANRTITVSAKTLTLGGAIGEDVAGRNLTKASAGTLTLGGSSTYSGSTLVTGGRLNVTGSLANTNVSVNAGTILGGTGSVAGTVTINGRLDPGTGSNVTSLISFGGSLGLASTATATFELAGTGRGTTYDAVNVTGALTLDGVVSVTGTHAFAAGNAFQLFNAGSINATAFEVATDLVLPVLPCSLAWDTSTFTTDGTVRVVSSPVVGAPTLAETGYSPLNGILRVRFSQVMDAASVTNLANYTVAGGGFALVSAFMPDALTVHLVPSPAPAAGSSHTVFISNLTNCAGTAIASNTAVSFLVPNFPLVSQLVAAFDGSSSTNSVIDGVNWRDLSGNRNDAVNVLTNASRRPTAVSSGLNGHPTLRFVRASSQTLSMDAVTGAGLGGSNHTWFFVVKPTYLASAANVLRHQSSLASGNWGSFFFEGNGGSLTANGRTTGGGAVEAVAFPVALSSWVIGSGYLDAMAGNVYSRVEAPEAGTSSAATNTAGTATGIGTPIATYIGSVANATFFDGEMAEVLIYTNALSAAERTQVEDYLRSKYFSAPQVVQHPQSADVLAGQPVTFSGAFTNAALYQWFKDGQPVAGATNSSYTIASVTAADAADYVLRGTNAAGHADTAPATLTVNHPPVASNTTAQVMQNQTLAVWLDKLLDRASDPDSDTLTVISAGPASTNGGTVTLTTSNILYQPVTDYTGADQFNYTVSDGRGGMATGAVSITVLSSNAVSLNIITPPTVLSNGHFFVSFAGIPGFNYTVQFSTNVNGPWFFMTNLTAGTNGLFDLEDPTEPPLPPTRFYRTTYP